MSEYKVIADDTFESISRKKYGTEVEAGRIARANPGVSEPLTAGTILAVPVSPEAPQNAPQVAPTNAENEVAILIGGKRFRFWGSVRITRAIDRMDVVEFGAPFDSSAPGFRETFRPFSYKSVDITVGGVPLFTGTMVLPLPAIEAKEKKIQVSCYSLPGVLRDCTAPSSSFPLEFNGLGLQEIATALANPFGIAVEFRADPGAVFEQVALEPGKKILDFLTELAKQRNLVIASTERGKLLFWQSIEVGSPVARLQQGSSPVLSVTPNFKPEEYYSHITGIDSVIVGLDGSQFTVRHPRLEGVTRPFTFNVPDSIDSDIKAAVDAKAGRMFANAASYSVPVDTWRDFSGKLWTPNTSLTLIAPDAMVYNEYEFILRSVVFDRVRGKETAVLNFVMPGAFSGGVPEVLPWDG